MPSHFSRGSKSVARRVLQALEGLKMVEKDQDGGRKLTPQGQRDLDRIAGQVSGDFSHHPGASGAWILTVSSSGGYSQGSRGAGERTFLTDFPSWGLGDRLECRALGEGSPGPGCSQLGLFCRARSLTGHVPSQASLSPQVSLLILTAGFLPYS